MKLPILIFLVILFVFRGTSSEGKIEQFTPYSWKLVFNDEFDGNSLDLSKWGTSMEFAGTHGPRYHNEYYSSYTLDEDVILKDGIVNLFTNRQTVSGTEPMGLFNYSQGFISSHDKFSFTYGYIEIKAKYPKGKGLWPCFWLMPASQNWPAEFDIAEYYGGQKKMHYGLAYGTDIEPLWDSTGDIETDFNNNWNIIGFEWMPGRAVWYVNGKVRKTILADYVPSTPMYIILSNSVSSEIGPSGSPDEFTVFPNSFEIDYVKVYRKE